MKPIVISLTLFVSFIIVTPGVSQTYHLILSTSSAGGGKSSSEMYTSTGILGEPAVGRDSSSSYGDGSGFFTAVSGGGVFPVATYGVDDGWNLISVARTVGDFRKTTLYPGATSAGFAYQGSYVQTETLKNGVGYWLRFPFAQSISIAGGVRILDSVTVSKGWNMIGSLTSPISKTDLQPLDPVEIVSVIWGYQSGTYVDVNTILPGKGYWVKVNNSGKIVMSAGALLLPAAPDRPGEGSVQENPQIMMVDFAKNLSSISITDRNGGERTLYFSSSRKAIDLLQYELPPPPPSEDLDARFASQRFVAFPDPAEGNPREFSIRVTGGRPPFTLGWNVLPDDEGAKLRLNDNENRCGNLSLIGSGSVALPEITLDRITLIIASHPEKRTPTSFALNQNYPNPFNPSTMIRYELPGQTPVLMEIYDVVGRRVAVLVDRIEKAGFHEIAWDASAHPSGIYYCRFTAGQFRDTKRLSLVK